MNAMQNGLFAFFNLPAISLFLLVLGSPIFIWKTVRDVRRINGTDGSPIDVARIGRLWLRGVVTLTRWMLIAGATYVALIVLTFVYRFTADVILTGFFKVNVPWFDIPRMALLLLAILGVAAIPLAVGSRDAGSPEGG